MNVHALKCWPPYFGWVRDDLKCLEVRLNDRDYREGDLLVLQEYLPTDEELQAASFNTLEADQAARDVANLRGMGAGAGFTGQVELALARHVLKDAPGLAPGYVAISLQRVVLAAPDAGEDGPGPN
jgi:hypothetical protein